MAEDYNLIKCDSKEMQALVDAAYNVGYKQGLEDGKKERPSLIYEKYEQGLNDAWEAARRIVLPSDCYANGLYSNMKEIFGLNDYLARGVFTDFSASEAVARIKEYEKKKQEQAKAEFKIGDEVISMLGRKAVILTVYDNDINIMFEDGSAGRFAKDTVKKTGKHFSQIVEILEQIRGDTND